MYIQYSGYNKLWDLDEEFFSKRVGLDAPLVLYIKFFARYYYIFME